MCLKRRNELKKSPTSKTFRMIKFMQKISNPFMGGGAVEMHLVMVWAYFYLRNFVFVNYTYAPTTKCTILDGSIQLQMYMGRFQRYAMVLTNSTTDYGVVDFEGTAFNSMTKILAFCGGRQVSSNLKDMPKILIRIA